LTDYIKYGLISNIRKLEQYVFQKEPWFYCVNVRLSLLIGEDSILEAGIYK